MRERRQIVLIEVNGGVAEESYLPPGVECVIYDHDDKREVGLTREEREAGAEEARLEARTLSESGASASGDGGARPKLHPAARRHLTGRFTARPHPDAYHTYHLESYPHEDDPSEQDESAFYAERERVRTYALLGLPDFVELLERALYLIPGQAEGTAKYRRDVAALFEHINLVVREGGAPLPASASASETEEE